jgi:hypothetical protein
VRRRANDVRKEGQKKGEKRRKRKTKRRKKKKDKVPSHIYFGCLEIGHKRNESGTSSWNIILNLFLVPENGS